MQMTEWQGVRFSQLMLGTVQFGLPYGIANRSGQPSPAEVRRIVAAALAGGVNTFDTASAYGTSEAVLGETLDRLGALDDVTIVTKIRPLTADELADPNLGHRAVRESVLASCRRLRLDHLPVVLFHREEDAVCFAALEELRKQGRVGHWGVSCDHDPGSAIRFIESSRVEALQLPGNLLDGRHLRGGVLPVAEQAHTAVFVRSVYLQGLLLMSDQEIPTPLRGVLSVRNELRTIARDGGMTLQELALRYVLSLPGVTSVVVGVETADQLEKNLAIFAQGPLTNDLIGEIERTVPELSPELITPRMWS